MPETLQSLAPDIKDTFNTRCVDGAAFPNALWLGNFTTGFETWKNPGGAAALPPLPDGVTKEFLAGKAQRDIDKNQTALAYTRGIIDQASAFKVKGKDGQETTYSRVDAVDDKKTGFSGAIYMNEKGHALVLYQGMAARSDPYSSTPDVIAYWQATQGRVDSQSVEARDLYVKAAEMSKSAEVIGFSFGTVHSNMLAAEYGAQVTNMSDFGLSKLYATPKGIESVEKNVQRMRIEGDVPPALPTSFIPKISVGGYGDGRMYAGKIYGDETMFPRPSAKAIIGEVDKLSPQNAHLFDPKTYPCSGGEQHTSEAYVLAQDRAAMEAKLPAVQPGNAKDLMLVLK